MEHPRDHIRNILDLLGPGLWLEMDKAAFPTFFGGDIGRESAKVEAARFAKDNRCCFISDGQTAKFGRAYSKEQDA